MKSESEFVVFIDESGDLELDTEKQGASNLFISVAVVLRRDVLEDAHRRLSKVSKDYFRGKEIKSSAVSNKHQRRVIILNEILKIDFSFSALVINKRKIYKDSGLRFKSSFYKYFNNQIFKRLSRLGKSIQIVADRYKSERFFIEFSRYVEKAINCRLKTPIKHSFDNAINQPCIQLPDFIAGTLSFCFDPDKTNEFSEEFRGMLKSKEIIVDIWPIASIDDYDILKMESSEFDAVIMESNIEKTMDVLDELRNEENSDSDVQYAVLNELLSIEMRFAANKSRKYMNKKKLLKLTGYPEMVPINFSSKIIAPLRVRGILLSGTRDGYKIVTSLRDIHDDIRDDAMKVLPMMNRLLSIRDAVKILTNNKLDVLDSYGNKLLKKILLSYKEMKESQALNGDGEKEEENL